MKNCLTLLLCLFPAICCVAGESLVLDDPLVGVTKGIRTGGELAAESYRPGLGQNHILYKLPRTVREGCVEFEVKGMDAAVVPKGGDHGFMAMYDGRGVEEPSAYFRDLKSNFYRWNVHWRQNRSAMKCVISCAEPTEARRNATEAQFGADQRDWTAEPTGKRVNWRPDQWHRFRVEWRNRVFRVLIDGEEVWRAEGPHDYAPVDHRLWLGCAPGKQAKYASHVPGIVYRNLKVIDFTSGSTSGSHDR